MAKAPRLCFSLPSSLVALLGVLFTSCYLFGGDPRAEPSSLTFHAAVNDEEVPGQAVSFYETGFLEEVTADQPWVSLEPMLVGLATAGGPDDGYMVTVDITGLGEGTHTATITAQGEDVRLTVPVTLVIGPPRRVFTVTPDFVLFVTVEGDPLPGPQTLLVESTDPGLRLGDLTVDEPAGWLEVQIEPSAGPTSPQTLTVAVVPSDLSPGTYAAQLLIDVPGGIDSPRSVPMTLVVHPAGTVLPVAGLADSPWPKAGRDARNSYTSDETGPADPEIAWAVQVAEPTRILGPAAIGPDGTFYFGATEPHLYAVREGEVLWSLELEDYIYDQYHKSPAVGRDGAIYFGAANSLYAVNPDGSLRFKILFGPPTGGMVGEGAPAIAPDGTVYIWALGEDYFAGNGLHAVSSQGVELWSVASGHFGTGTPVVRDDGTVLFAQSYQGRVRALSSSGDVMWRWDAPLLSRLLASTLVLAPDGTICTSDANGTIFMLSATGSLIGQFGAGDPSYPPLVDGDGTLFLCTRYGELRAVRSGGSIIWELDLGEYSGIPVMDASGTIYVGVRDADSAALVVAVSSGGSVIWSIDVPEVGVKFSNAPGLVIGEGGELVVSSSDTVVLIRNR